MDTEVPLPPPPRVRHRSPANSTTTNNTVNTASRNASPAGIFKKPRRLSRALHHSSEPLSLSSDPALFSSDDIPASGLENYRAPEGAGAGKKRRYRGTWWGETVMDMKNKKKKTETSTRGDFKEKRFVDSGVWMGSDESLSGGSLLPSEEGSTWGEDLLKQARDANVLATESTPQLLQPGPQTRVAARKIEEPREHQLAQAVVNDCLEKGRDTVDLSDCDLKTIPRGLLQPLQHLTILPPVKEPPITEDVFRSFAPWLRLYLSGNELTALPSELFELDQLRVLSVRNNKLTEIPPAIRNLTRVQVVNVSVNNLTCLPHELLRLVQVGDLRHLTVQPNPLLQIEDADIAQWHWPPTGREESQDESCVALQMFEYDHTDIAPREALDPIHVATGPVRRYNMDGMPVAGELLDSSTSRTPSLREAALLALTKSPFFDQIPTDMENYPALMARLLDRAREVRFAGGRVCSVCSRPFVIPRTEWIEWWDCSTIEKVKEEPRAPLDKLRPLPFRRLGCSWACVPQKDPGQISRRHAVSSLDRES